MFGDNTTLFYVCMCVRYSRELTIMHNEQTHDVVLLIHVEWYPHNNTIKKKKVLIVKRRRASSIDPEQYDLRYKVVNDTLLCTHVFLPIV